MPIDLKSQRPSSRSRQTMPMRSSISQPIAKACIELRDDRRTDRLLCRTECRDHESTVELLEFLLRCSKMNHRVSGSSIPEIQVNLATPSEEELDSTIRQGLLRSPDRFGISARHGLPERYRRVRKAIPHPACSGVVRSNALISELRIASLRQNLCLSPAGGVIPEFWSVIPDESIQLSQVSQLVPAVLPATVPRTTTQNLNLYMLFARFRVFKDDIVVIIRIKRELWNSF
jgi:hypothetical protein